MNVLEDCKRVDDCPIFKFTAKTMRIELDWEQMLAVFVRVDTLRECINPLKEIRVIVLL